MSFLVPRQKKKKKKMSARLRPARPTKKEKKGTNKRDSVGSRVLSRAAPALIGSGVSNGRLVALASGNGPRSIGLRAAPGLFYLFLSFPRSQGKKKKVRIRDRGASREEARRVWDRGDGGKGGSSGGRKQKKRAAMKDEEGRKKKKILSLDALPFPPPPRALLTAAATARPPPSPRTTPPQPAPPAASPQPQDNSSPPPPLPERKERKGKKKGIQVHFRKPQDQLLEA